MTFENPFSVVDEQRAENVSDTPKLVVEATFNGIRALVTFGQQYISPVLSGQLALSQREDVLVTIYRRIFAYLASIAVLGLPQDAQAIASLTRSVFELFVDFKSIQENRYPDGPRKFLIFTPTERLRIAQKTVEFDDQHPGVLRRPPDVERNFIASDHARIEAEALALWGTVRPKHWSGVRDLQTRAKNVGVEQLYITYYPQLSNFVHSGAAGFHGISLETFAALVSLCHMLAVQRGVETLQLLADELPLGAAINGLTTKMQFLGSVQKLLLVDLKLMSLGEPQRLFLELHWSDERRGRAPNPPLQPTGA